MKKFHNSPCGWGLGKRAISCIGVHSMKWCNLFDNSYCNDKPAMSLWESTRVSKDRFLHNACAEYLHVIHSKA